MTAKVSPGKRMALSTIVRELACALLDAAKNGDLRGHLSAWRDTVADDRMPHFRVFPRH